MNLRKRSSNLIPYSVYIYSGISLSEPDCFYFAAANGWLELGVPSEAVREISLLSRAAENDADILCFKCKLFLVAREFEKAQQAAQKLLERQPDDLDGWLTLAESVWQIEGARNALNCLEKRRQFYSENYRFCLALSRYFALSGDVDNAKEWILNSLSVGGKPADARAFPELHPHLRSLARGE